MTQRPEEGTTMDIAIDRTSSVPIYVQISQQIRALITSGSLPAGFRLPPERRLASALGVTRGTVLAAYRELRADALLDAHVGRGTVVLPQRFQGGPATRIGIAWSELFRAGAGRAQDPLVRDLLELTERNDVVSLAVGLPAPELMPLATLHHLLDEVIAETGAAALLHCPTEGHTPLREAIAEVMATRGIRVTPAEVLVVSGAQQGLDLAARVFLDPGDLVVVEEPSYFGALQAFRTAQARFLPVAADEDGMRTDLLEAALRRHRPKLIYTLPTFQNPSGHVMSLDRRRHLLELATSFQVPVLEDDPYSELRYEGEPLPSLKALDDAGVVLHLSTFSKALFPGLRLGWLLAPRPAIRQFALVKQVADLHSSTLGQCLIERFLRRGYWGPFIRACRAAYAARRDTMLSALAAEAPAGMTWRRPEGGFYLWSRLPDGTGMTRLLTRAAEAGVAFLPGRACFVNEPGADFIRLSFSLSDEGRIRDGIHRLVTAIRESTGQPRAVAPTDYESRPIV
ncbi:MAG: PLP-dependent aminotransferase family protein [Acidobacteriota bacterium]